MIIGIGSDIVNIQRIEETLRNFGERFALRCFAQSEREDCDCSPKPVFSYAKRFAAKEACSKALGTGIEHGVSWKDMVVTNLPSGKPCMLISGRASEKLLSLIPYGSEPIIHLTMSDDFPFAQAFVVIESCSRRSS
ncbi:holo-ACP synthase [Candidatus Liberibacter sp.]|uniref:holo-ACP synthase n=1 Tax=Candidatus Liberibacter sp. TaxID=34022 RepID=UPI0015F59177|nr:holo-ACP synthase [Candidatus Liberibacter sp.]MBA5723994.1 holo-ACP synthase [Candidatus Liberibacter sp.]